MPALRTAKRHPAVEGVALFVATIEKGAVIRVGQAGIYVLLFEVSHGVLLAPSVYHAPGNERFKHGVETRVQIR